MIANNTPSNVDRELQEKLTEILDQLIDDYKYYGFSNAGMFAKATYNIKALIHAHTHAAVERVIERVEEIIGNDDTPTELGNFWNVGRNQLRAEQRATLNKIKGEY